MIMKKTNLRKFTAIITGLVLMCGMGWAQELGTSNLYQHGSNAKHDFSYGPESIDSVSVGSTMEYYVQPDANISPSYVYTSPLANLNSTFTWTATPATGVTITTKSGTLDNWKTIKWANLGSYNLNVKEQANTGTCPDGTGKTINVAVINLPTAAVGTSPAAQCATDPSSITFIVPFTLTSDLVAGKNNTVRINYTVLDPDGNTFISPTDADFSLTNPSISPTLNIILTNVTKYGDYKFVINSVSDRISRKSSVPVTYTALSETLTVNRVPVTGPIYHLPNM